MKTLFVGQNNIHLNSVASTNSYASELLRQIKPVEGTLIYTFDQQNGRGQRGSGWESEANKNIALSLILNPSFLQADNQFLITKIISLSVADLMAEWLHPHNLSSKIKIKWPNDIYVGDKKIAGILIENTLRENNIQSSIIGIGININQTEFITTKNATSLKTLTNKEVELMPAIEQICEFIEARYLQLKTNKLESINNAYLQNLYRFEEWSNYSSKYQEFVGKITGVSSSGKLQMELSSHEKKEFDLKEIIFCS
ncbi:MAG: biotin--[acetyl-CoA-carboxylase] ligase [Bacteroidetes bacterium RIFCSPLOWO2_12_FULL_35_15]|nr:MAG: biotin--[acetyl-CoA-carboxylase] ligase [Bacteroidetes bacterium RIFCSPLOWO2_12_FULL_35_15]